MKLNSEYYSKTQYDSNRSTLIEEDDEQIIHINKKINIYKNTNINEEETSKSLSRTVLECLLALGCFFVIYKVF